MILVTNHDSLSDVPHGSTRRQRQDSGGVAKQELWRFKPVGCVLDSFGAFSTVALAKELTQRVEHTIAEQAA